ncbi:hypothetical protein RhiirA5_460952 [Rhizophagus irregularis]|uniref:Microtubule-associated protein 1a n=1 Tax=Rhizophagus irregularis TaxID=588596 RepID=A0A2N0QDU1_9GLOM|nr:hypothetical protein RhiirA5_460952 [Rhizophagus irregularis]
MAQSVSEVTNYQTNYDPIYEEIKLNKKLNEELKFSETLCNQLKNKYENLEKYCKDLQDNFNNVNNILREKQELKKKIVGLDDHNSKLVKLLVETLEEKNNIIQEKDNAIQEKDKIQITDDLIQERDKEIQERDKEIQERDKEIQEKDKEIQEKDKEIQEKDKEIQEKNKEIQEKDKEIQEKDKGIQEKDKEIQEKNKEIQKLFEEKDKKFQEKDKEIRDLEHDNYNFKKEASEYQYALEGATNLQLSDSDTNNTLALKNDILKLQDLLEDYITTCKGNVEININEIQKLLKRYKSNSVITKDQKPLIKALLQRHVIEEIFEYGEKYFDFNNLQNYNEYGSGTETYLYNRTCDLLQLAEVIAEKRDGVDDITRVLPIRLRQEVFAALGNRGFNKIIAKTGTTFPHEFISGYQDILNKEISKYRKLKDPQKKQEIEDMAGEIIRKFVTLFWFRLGVQEPIAEYIWFDYNDNINSSYMEGTWEIDEIENIVVDICYFPLIAQNFDDKSKRQIYTPARISHKIKTTTIARD